MASASGADRKHKPGSSSRDPELSLSWCISKLPKRSDSAPDKRARMAQWRALVAIRTHHIKGHRSSISRFRREGGLASLLELLKQPDCSRKTLDLALSILGNCCTERETCAQVRKLDGINIIVDIMKRQVALVSVQNRAARALGNMALEPESSALIHKAGGVPLLLLCISHSSSSFSPSSPHSSSGTSTAPSSPSPPATPDSTTTTTTAASSSSSSTSSSAARPSSPPLDSSPALECAQSAARALLHLCDSSSHRLALLSHGALSSLAPLVAPEFPSAVRRGALRALHELTRGCGVECARQVARSGVLPQLGALAVGEDGEDEEGGKAMEELALKTLANVCAQGCLRPLVGSVGAIRRFCDEVKRDALKSAVFLKALCLCCKEAVNRVKVKECGGLELLTGFISSHQDHPLSRLAIWACVDFVFDEVAMETLQELGLVPVLVERLVRLCEGSNLPPADVPRDCMDSFDFPAPEEKKGALCSSSSFLSLRSWLLSEGLISSEGDLLDSSSTEPDWSGLALGSPPAPSCSHKPPLPSPVSSSTPKPPDTKPPPSTCSPGAAKTPASVSKFKLGSPHRRKQRASVLKLPLETPPSACRPASFHPYHPEPWTPESPILLLLSRFSHVSDPSGALVNAAAMSGLLLYLTRHPDPSARAFRLLLRLSENPNCLQALVRSGAAAMIRYRLCGRGAGPDDLSPETPEERRQSPRVRAKVRQLGLNLLSNLQLQCEGAFGAGVLSHLLLSGSESDRLHSALCLPLLTSNKSLLKKLLLDSGGLQLALRPLGGDSTQTAPQCPLRPLYLPLLAGCLSALTKPSVRPAELDPLSPPAAKKPHLAPPPCRYSAAAMDLTFLLDDGTTLSANRDTISGGHSEYFRALLKGGFGEASGTGAIPIRDVCGAMLSPVLHHLHGCRFNAAPTDRCPTLSHYVDGPAFSETGQFEETRLGKAMISACRFLVDDLRTELEDVCVSALKPGPTHGEEVANRTLDSDRKTQESPDIKSLKRKLVGEAPGEALEGALGGGASGGGSGRDAADGGWVLAHLPQMYWFAQRYSYSKLARACLSVLLGAPRSQWQVAEALGSLVQEADCVQTLKRDLVELVTDTLSC